MIQNQQNKVDTLYEKSMNLVQHIDRLHDTNIDLALNLMKSLEEGD
jgi:hypothetical protein